jgi:hypothetical protein
MTYRHDNERRRCDLDGCERVHKGHGLCELHLERLKRTGTTDDPPAQTLADRFWSKVDKRGPDECWLWTAVVNEHGYGVMRPEGQRHGPTVKAHRVSLMLADADIEGRYVLHSCDNRRCVNPAHLSAGDHRENVADMVGRQRQARGSRNGEAKLTEQQVAEIRARAGRGELHRILAAEYGVSRPTISRVVNRGGWRHVG